MIKRVSELDSRPVSMRARKEVSKLPGVALFYSLISGKKVTKIVPLLLGSNGSPNDMLVFD